MKANRGRAERSLLALFAGKHERGRLPCSPSVCGELGERDLTALLLIFHLNTGEAEGLFHEKFLPFKNLHILIQENKEKLSYTLEEDHYSIPTIPKARRQPAASLIGALWRRKGEAEQVRCKATRNRDGKQRTIISPLLIIPPSTTKTLIKILVKPPFAAFGCTYAAFGWPSKGFGCTYQGFVRRLQYAA